MEEFSKILEEWYASNGRSNLPWRGISDPYLIWISEIILQQTRVEQGRDYYLQFIERFPDVFSLAEAEEDEVLKLWQGLGYYSRARNLHAAAKTVVAAGAFPETYEGVRTLKGIGDYTAAAVCSFAYQLPYPVVDGNVYRVLSRIFGIETPIDTQEGKKKFIALAKDLLDKGHPDIYNSAIMDFGAIQCTPKSPDCMFCPFTEICIAFRSGRVQELPVKSKKMPVKNRYFVYVYIEDAQHLLLRRRPKGDIWQGLYEPYLMEFGTLPSEADVMSSLSLLTNVHGTVVLVAKGLNHLLTHRKLQIDCYRLTMDRVPELDGYIKVPKILRDDYATSKIVSTLYSLIDKA